MWLDSLLSATGRSTRNSAQPWPEIESELGTELPGDYKKLCVAFGVGEFSEAVSVLRADETLIGDLLTMWRRMLEDDQEGRGLYPPYRIHAPGTTGGLIPWATRAADIIAHEMTQKGIQGRITVDKVSNMIPTAARDGSGKTARRTLFSALARMCTYWK